MNKGRKETNRQKQKHIAFYIGSLQKGGTERVLLNLADFFHNNNYKVSIVTQKIGANEYRANADIRRIMSDLSEKEIGKSRILNYFRRICKLRRIWKDIKPDLVLSFIGKNNFQAIESTLGLKSKVVVSVVGDPKEEYFSSIMRILTKTLFLLADGIVLKTSEAKSFFPSYLYKKLIVMKNSLNPAFIKPSFQGQREKTIISVGRLDRNKNHGMIIRAFAEISSQYPDYKVLLYGEGEARAELEELVREFSLEGKVSLPGIIQDVPNTIYQGGIFVLSSYTEGMPNALLEAMALGIPVISTDCPCGGPKEVIRDKENGLLIPVGDVAQLVQALKYLLDNPENTKKLGEKASEIQQELSPDHINNIWKNYFEAIMKGK